MNVAFIPPADQELLDAINFYDKQFPGGGQFFSAEFQDVVEAISNFPRSWQLVGSRTRKCLLKKFPYLVLYIVDDDWVFITAVAHQHRRPESYLKRRPS